MEALAPPLHCLIEIQGALLTGETARVGLNRYLADAKADPQFRSDIRRFLFSWDQGQDWRAAIARIQSPHRRVLLDLAATALAGAPIQAHLEELRREIVVAADLEIRHHLEVLPIKMLVPLLFLQFPAFLLLLFGPLLGRLLEDLSRS